MKCKHCNGTGKVKDGRDGYKAQDFINEVHTIWKENYSNKHIDIIYEFVSYWTEPNKSKTKMRFELEKTWDTKRRLQTWLFN